MVYTSPNFNREREMFVQVQFILCLDNSFCARSRINPSVRYNSYCARSKNARAGKYNSYCARCHFSRVLKRQFILCWVRCVARWRTLFQSAKGIIQDLWELSVAAGYRCWKRLRFHIISNASFCISIPHQIYQSSAATQLLLDRLNRVCGL